MKKVANCFMSLGSLSRARAIFNGVMSKNSCRVVLIALVMFVCGNGAVFAQLADGDIVTISVTTTDRGNVTYHYLSAVENQNTVTDKTTPDEYSLWRVTKSGEQYKFVNVGAEADGSNAGLRVNNNALQITSTNSASGFQFGTKGYDPGESQTAGRLYYTASNGSNKYKYIHYSDTNWSISSQKDDKQNTPSLLTIETWTLKEEKGGISGTFSPSDPILFPDLDKTDSVARAHAKTINFIITRTAPSQYYQCDNRPNVTTTRNSGTQSPINLEMLSVAWQSIANDTTSKANCSNYENAAVTSRPLMQFTRGDYINDQTTITIPITITPVGSSPMEMKTADGKWTDHHDNLVIRFREADETHDDTYTANLPVTRYAYHREELPAFVVNSSNNTHIFGKTGDTISFTFFVTHQHGYKVQRMYYNDSGVLEVDRDMETVTTLSDTITDLSFASFAAKNIEDETNATWLHLSHTTSGPTNGTITLAADTNSTGIRREARVIATFAYTNPNNATDHHTEVIVIPISQNGKDGSIAFHHQKGHYNTEFGKNPYSGEQEQLVHTSEQTIYYLPTTQISLALPEVHYRGWKRWYDYKTGGDPQYNPNASDRTTWATAPLGNPINTSIGDSHGIYDTQDRNANTPVINTWTDGKTHVIACDLSNYKDYTPSTINAQTTSITEPTLSYRQLFYLKPAKEMADSLTARSLRGEYFETHYYTAPTGKNIYLATNYNHSLANETSNSYFYYKGTTITRVSGIKWYSNDSVITNVTYGLKDYLSVSSTTDTTITYDLRLPGAIKDANNQSKDLLIARFVVTYAAPSTYGPSTTTLISREEIQRDYLLLEEINFSYEGEEYTGKNNTQVYHPLPWLESTYGYYYPEGVLGGNDKYYRHSNRTDNNIPYFGEYCLVKELDLAWADQADHTGDGGYVMYVDGTQEPQVVARISTDAVICSGQTLYCSMWLCNPARSSHNGTNPIFRCNVQGRRKTATGYTEWEDVGVFFVGELPKGASTGNNWGSTGSGGSWHQLRFPVSSNKDYDETRVSIYNFGIGNDGNDFMVDDIFLYVSPLPLAAYQATMGCQSAINTTEASTAVVVRMNYADLNTDLHGKFAYYQIYNETKSRTVKLKTTVNRVVNDSIVNDSIVSAYYQENPAITADTLGSVAIPAADYVPNSENDNVQTSLSAYLGTLMNANQRFGKCYVKDSEGKWYLYVIHIVPNTDEIAPDEDADLYLKKDEEYILRIAQSPGDLGDVLCSSTTELHATQDTYIELRNQDLGTMRVECVDQLCANDFYFLDLKVQNTLAPSVGGALQTIEAVVHSDWLLGVESDDAYCNPRTMTEAQKTAANAAFVQEYGCTRDSLRTAIAAMRRVSTNEHPNPNYAIGDPDLLQVTNDFTTAQVALIQRLCREGKLTLYKTTVGFYLASESTMRYWAYPVAENAKVTFAGQEYTLVDCDEPKWVKVKSASSDYGVNLAPRDEDGELQSRQDIPTIRVLEGVEKISFNITELLEKTQVNSLLATNQIITFKYNEPRENVLEYVDLSDNDINIVGAPDTLQPGEEYMMRMAFYDEQGEVFIGGHEDSCRVGFVYFYLKVVPKRLTWTGAKSSAWGDDANWDGGCAPLPETNVIIPADLVQYPVVATTDLYPMDVNYTPNACNDIYFAPGAMIHNQHLLQYNRAFVDMTITPATWNSMAAPMQGMYTGDMYVPHSGNWQSGQNLEFTNVSENSQYPFVVNSFKGVRTSSSAYAFWQSIYNKRVQTYHENGNQSTPTLTSTEQFVQTNSLGYALAPGTGYQVLGYDPENISGDIIIVRLPKPDTYYSYYTNQGVESDQRAYVTHSPKLAFTPDVNGNMRITLTSDVASNKFMFGNPTMANIDMKKFLQANSNVLAAYYVTMDNSTWNANTLLTNGENEAVLHPMRSAMLQLKDKNTATSITLTLSAEHLVTNNPTTDNVVVNMPARRNAPADDAPAKVMHIYSSSSTGGAHCVLAADACAKDSYENDEDVLFFSSGVEQGVDGSTATSPINMYTVSKQVPMMVDVRANIDTVPVSMLVHDSYRTDKVKFAFYLSLNWDKECYFWDSKTDEKFRILDGLWLEMDMPYNHEPRYYITGPDRASNDDVITSTTNPSMPETGSEISVWAYSQNSGELIVNSSDIIKEVKVYNLAGALVAQKSLKLWNSTVAMSVQSGICIVEATMRDNSKHYTQTLVR